MKKILYFFFVTPCFFYSQDKCPDCPNWYEEKKFEEIITTVKPLGDKASVNDLLYLGKSFQSIGDKKNAIKAYETLLLIDDQNVDACVAVSALFIEVEHFENAKFAAERALKFDKNNEKALYNLGVIYYYQKDLSKFDQHVKKYINKKETKDEFLYLIALTQIDQEKYDQAIVSLEDLEKVNPSYEYLNFYLGYCHFKSSEFDKAKDKFTIEAKKNNEIGSEAYYYLAHTNIHLNNKVDACEAYNQAINLGDITIEKEANAYCDENKGKKFKAKVRDTRVRL
ncbi:MAG: tetratricopeptide repeat protein [Flavobacteriia bacterium]|nr:tetratricopeptide repeat protein [Flavobacteriia bacterium]